MKKTLQAFLLSATGLLSGAGQAALVEFDTSQLLMTDVFGGTGLYEPTGTFVFDTDAQTVLSVDVQTQNAAYISGEYDADFEAFGLFTASGVNGLVLDISIDFTELQLSLDGLVAGDDVYIGADPYEYDNSDGTEYGLAVDPILVGTVLPAAVPLPASLPLLLTGLGGLSLLARRRKTA